MALILNIETSSTVCSVALAKDGECIALAETDGGYTHAENLTVFIEQVMKQSGKTLQQLDAIAVSKGPGSYTGLRIGVSTAKGLCYALEKPLLGINMLKAMAAGAVQTIQDKNAWYCPMLDARRMEVYCAVYDYSLRVIRATTAVILDATSFLPLLEMNKICFFGNGSDKYKVIPGLHQQAVFTEGVKPSAKGMMRIAEQHFTGGNVENTAYFEPDYLKDFAGGGTES